MSAMKWQFRFMNALLTYAWQRGAGPSSSSRSRASQPTFTRTLRRNSCSDKRPQPSPLPQGRLRQLLLQRRAANRWPAAGSIGKKTSACVPSASAPALSSLAAGDWYSFLRLMNGAPKPTLRAVMEIQAPQVRRAGVRSLAAAFRSLPLPAIVEMLQLRCNDDASSITACTFSPVHCRNRARMTCGSWAEAAALRAVLEDAAAAGVRGAQVALEGLSAWGPGCSEFGDVGALPAELAFRS
ncbi:hypothetical protein Vretimale_11622 [Volvox reticuliferus]|uniref:Uncharacterized protein n=1 Tax=Volvox reticuliferus TaxID=1737510 RepID=A0A8J4LR42_9CHLO|nr:hypothetical protein Vretimale_11622 [Volvox reticuliferus]